MRTHLDDDDFEHRLATVRRSAWRWEQQPVYALGHEDTMLEAFRAGRPQLPTQNPGMRGWLRQVREQTQAGVAVARVRVLDVPPTDYQRWLLWSERWNVEAGERIGYISRAELAGLPPQPFGTADWWLLDEEAVALMPFDSHGHREPGELITDPLEVAAAVEWRYRMSAATRHEVRPSAAA